MSLPAATRRRWEMHETGGTVTYLDVGNAVVLLPGSVLEHRRAIFDQLSEQDWADANSGFGDPDLATQ